jgi:hypothetical protein
MKELSNLVELIELFELLGYQDERSVIRWCGSNNIPVVKLGLKKYISSHLLTQTIDSQIVIFVKGKKLSSNKNNLYKPDNETISKYLKKYESSSKVLTSKKA